MTLSNAILFPRALLPLYIFEPRYRRMLEDSLNSHRTLAVAMRKPGRSREVPSLIAGLGMIRAAVTMKDGTSHIILQGLARVHLTTLVRYKPYRLQCIEPLETTGVANSAIDELVASVMALVVRWFKQGCELPPNLISQMSQILSGKDQPEEHPQPLSTKQILDFLTRLENPESLADLISWTLLPDAAQRQTILEALDLETRLRFLIHFLQQELQRKESRAKNPQE